MDLFDLDPRALARARRRCGLHAPWVRCVVLDVTGGAADRILTEARTRATSGTSVPTTPVGDGPYDVVIGDLRFSQLLYSALANADLPAELIDRVLLREGPALTDAVLARLCGAAAPGGHVVCVHDVLGWWEGHPQPFLLDAVLALA